MAKHGLSTEQFPVSAYVGSSKNLKDLKDQTLKQVDSAMGEAMVAPQQSPASFRVAVKDLEDPAVQCRWLAVSG